MNDAEKLKSTLSSIFSRKGRDGHYTRLFENLESRQKDALLSKVQLNEGELAVIGSAESADKWLIITTERIVWGLDGKEQSLSARDVQDAVTDFRKLVATGRKKDEMRQLQIISKDGGRHILEVEEGAPLMGVWNALKNLGARNRQVK